ncbi:MAG: hypothetical protein ACJ74G_07355 [Blastocatellia bacterium]
MRINANAASASLGRRLGMALTLLLYALPLIVPPFANAGATRYQIRINNRSGYDIHRIYMSWAESNSWGRDLLGSRILASYGSFRIVDIVPGEWDIKFVDEDGDACILRNVKVFEDTSWSITDDWLINCESYGRCHCRGDDD